MKQTNKQTTTATIKINHEGDNIFKVAFGEKEKFIAFPRDSEQTLEDVTLYLFQEGLNFCQKDRKKAIEDLGGEY